MPKQITLAELAKLTDATLCGNPQHVIKGVGTLEEASVQEAAFLENARYKTKLRHSQAGVIFAEPAISPVEGRNFLFHATPSASFQKVIEFFLSTTSSGFSTIHPSAVIHETAVIGEDVCIGPHVIVDQNAKIGKGTRIEGGSFIGAEVVIGEKCHFYPHVTIRERCHIGNRVILQPGAVIGSCGYGYVTDNQGKHTRLTHLGNVVVDDDVEIGANTTIDRARFQTTYIGKGTKIDNLVQIAHQVKLGENNLIVSQTGIAGSSSTGKNVMMGGQVGIIGHISIGDKVILAARTAAIKSIEKSGIYSGVPATPVQEYNELMVYFKKIRRMAQRLKALEEKLQHYEDEEAK